MSWFKYLLLDITAVLLKVNISGSYSPLFSLEPSGFFYSCFTDFGFFRNVNECPSCPWKPVECLRPQMEFWKSRGSYTVSSNSDGRSERADTVYMVVPLLGVALLIIIGLFLLWRCQLQKATRRRPAYTQNRYLANNRSTRSLPRILVYRETVAHDSPHQESNSHPTVIVSGAERGEAGREGGRGGGLDSHGLHQHNTRSLYVQDSSFSVASRLSGATPPPSYEEVTGHLESSGDETAAPSYSDPPPKYEEIIKEK